MALVGTGIIGVLDGPIMPLLGGAILSLLGVIMVALDGGAIASEVLIMGSCMFELVAGSSSFELLHPARSPTTAAAPAIVTATVRRVVVDVIAVLHLVGSEPQSTALIRQSEPSAERVGNSSEVSTRPPIRHAAPIRARDSVE